MLRFVPFEMFILFFAFVGLQEIYLLINRKVIVPPDWFFVLSVLVGMLFAYLYYRDVRKYL